MAARPLARAYHALATPGPWSFAVLTAIEGSARASFATVIPLLAFEVMGNAR